MTVQTIGLKDAVRLAMEITSSFEGNHGWSSVAGNFDGQGITCGALGFAWAAGVHQKIVLRAEEQKPGLVQSLMPAWGSKYLTQCALPPKTSLSMVSSWSTNGKLDPGLRAELVALWGCEQMVASQVWAAESVYVRQALSDMSKWTKKPTLRDFCFFFDTAIQSGSLGHVPQDLTGSEFQKAIEMLSGATKDQAGFLDSKENAKLWSATHFIPHQLELLGAAYLRAKRSKTQWQLTVLNRRGSIAMGKGWVNRALRDFSDKGLERELT